MTRKQISAEIFGRNLIATKLSEALNYLRRLGLAYFIMEPGSGRAAERWFAKEPKAESLEYD